MGNQQRIEIVMDAKTQLWLAKFAEYNYWRVASYIELDDLIQDGFVIFHKVRQRYREQGRQHKHIINTFKLSFRNHVHDLANQRTQDVPQLPVVDIDWENGPDVLRYAYPLGVCRREFLSPRELESQHLASSIRQAPFRVREVLKVFASEDGRARLRKPYRMRGDGSRETLNERLCRIAGFDPAKVDLATTVRSYFGTD